MKITCRVFQIALALCMFYVAEAKAQDVSSGVTANFQTKKHLKGFKKPWVSSGCFAVVPKAGLVWKVEKPFLSVVEVSDTGVKSMTSSGQIQKLEGAALPTFRTLKATLVSAFLGEWQQMSSMFVVKEHSAEDGFHVTLTPKEADVPFHELDIRGGEYVKAVRMENRAGDIDDMTFSAQRVITANSISELSAFVQKCR